MTGRSCGGKTNTSCVVKVLDGRATGVRMKKKDLVLSCRQLGLLQPLFFLDDFLMHGHTCCQLVTSPCHMVFKRSEFGAPMVFLVRFFKKDKRG